MQGWILFWFLVQLAAGTAILAVPTIAFSRWLRRVIVAYKNDAAVSSGPRAAVLLDAIFDPAVFPEHSPALVRGEAIPSHASPDNVRNMEEDFAVKDGADSA